MAKSKPLPTTNDNAMNEMPVMTETKTQTKVLPLTVMGLGFAGLVVASGFFFSNLFNNLFGSPKSANTNTNRAAAAQPVWLTATQALQTGKVTPADKILEVNLSYDRDHDPILVINSTRQLNGHVPKDEGTGTDYTLQTVNSGGQVASSVKFTIPNVIHGPLPEVETEHSDADIELTQTDFTITLPWSASAADVQVLDADQVLVTSASLSTTTTVANQANFHSINGRDFLNPSQGGSQSNRGGFIPVAQAQTTTNYFDLTFVGDNYAEADLGKFHTDINRFVSYVMAIEPFKSRAAQIQFHYIDNTADLGCQHDAVITRGIYCSDTAVAQVVNNSGVPFDRVAVIFNDGAYGGAASVYGIGRYTISYNGSTGPQVFAHETGHSIANFMEEYDNYGTAGPILNRVYYRGIDGTDPGNCLSGTPPALDWNGLVGLNDYVAVCYYPNWYEPGVSLMKTNGSKIFNSVDQRYLNQKLDFYASPFVSADIPVATITAPTSGATVSGTVTVTATASDSSGVTWAEFWVDGAFLKTDWEAPYSFSWNTTSAGNGNHTLEVKARDAANNIGSSTPVTVTIGNITDTVSPTVTLTAPPTGSTVSGTVAVSATASDNIGVAGVQFKLDGANLSTEDTVAPYAVSWNTAAAPGSHTLTAVARDAAGNTTVSAPVTVTVVIPLTISGVTTSGLTTTGATVKWTTNVASIGTVALATGQTMTESTATTSHSLTFTGLVKSTRYNFTITATSVSNGTAIATGSFRTKAK